MKKFLTIMTALTLMLLPCVCSAESREGTMGTYAQTELVNSFAPILDYARYYTEPELTMNLDVTLKRNWPKDPVMNLYVDGYYVTTVYEGQTFRGSYLISRGAHTITIEHNDRDGYYCDTFSFSLVSDDSTITLAVKDHDVVGYYEVDVLRVDVANWQKQ